VDGPKFFLALLLCKTVLFSFPLSASLRLESYVRCLEFIAVEFLVFFHLFVFLFLPFFLSVSFLYTDLDQAFKLLVMCPSELKVPISMNPYV
jgi:hypothetical protein